MDVSGGGGALAVLGFVASLGGVNPAFGTGEGDAGVAPGTVPAGAPADVFTALCATGLWAEGLAPPLEWNGLFRIGGPLSGLGLRVLLLNGLGRFELMAWISRHVRPF